MAGDFSADDRLRARDLAHQWDVSETPVREAFQRLVASGFLVYNSQRGVRVASITLEELDELFQLRLVLEPVALKRSIEQANPGWEARVIATYSAMDEAAADATNRQDYEIANRRWHYALVSASGESWWPRTVELLRDQTARYWVVRPQPRTIEEMAAEHELIQEAALVRDVREAPRLLREHIAASQRHIRAYFGTHATAAP